VLKTVYRTSCRDKHNCQQHDLNLGPLTLQTDALTTRLLRPAVISMEFNKNMAVSKQTAHSVIKKQALFLSTISNGITAKIKSDTQNLHLCLRISRFLRNITSAFHICTCQLAAAAFSGLLDQFWLDYLPQSTHYHQFV